MGSELTSNCGRDIDVRSSRLLVAATTQVYTAYIHAGRFAPGKIIVQEIKTEKYASFSTDVIHEPPVP